MRRGGGLIDIRRARGRYFKNLRHRTNGGAIRHCCANRRISRRALYNEEETNGENGEFLQFRRRRYAATIVKRTTSAGNGLASALYFPRISFLIGGWSPWLTTKRSVPDSALNWPEN